MGKTEKTLIKPKCQTKVKIKQTKTAKREKRMNHQNNPEQSDFKIIRLFRKHQKTQNKILLNTQTN